MINNIYESCGDFVREYESKGLIPVLYLESVGRNQLCLVKRVHIARGIVPNDFVFVQCGQEVNQSGTKLNSFILFANNEEDAIDGFRRRVSYSKFLSRSTANGAIPRLYGIDASGNVCPSNYVPIFNIKSICQRGLDEIVEEANSQVRKYARGVIRGKINSLGDAHIYFQMREDLANLKDIKSIRSKMMNSFCKNYCGGYEIELLDERGGKNWANIEKFLFEEAMASNLAKSALMNAKQVEKNYEECACKEVK